jgi:hypothetical protein
VNASQQLSKIKKPVRTVALDPSPLVFARVVLVDDLNLGPHLGDATDMARFRNPRYAPESLERRLSPSAFLTSALPAAQVMVLDTEPYAPPIPVDQVPPDPSDGPLELPPPPINPIQPA